MIPPRDAVLACPIASVKRALLTEMLTLQLRRSK